MQAYTAPSCEQLLARNLAVGNVQCLDPIEWNALQAIATTADFEFIMQVFVECCVGDHPLHPAWPDVKKALCV